MPLITREYVAVIELKNAIPDRADGESTRHIVDDRRGTKPAPLQA
jgi:hypothetical protein